MKRRLLTKLALLAGVLATLQIAAYWAFPERGVPSPVLLCDRFLAEGRDVIYFGDSTLYRGHPEEGANPTLPKRVADALPGFALGAIAHDAYHPVLYASFCRYFAKKPKRPKLVIVALQLRAFSVERDRRPEYQFERERLFLRYGNSLLRAFFTPLATWGVFDLEPISQEDYENTPVSDGDDLLGTVKDLSPPPEVGLNEQTVGPFITLCYMYRLTPDHRQLRALVDTAKVCEDAGMAVLFYVSPVDYELGNTLYGDSFGQRIRENVAVIAASLEGRNAVFLDLAMSLERSAFVLDSFPDGYLREEGKQFVAMALAEVAGTILQSGAQEGL